MSQGQEMPLQELLQALSRTPVTQPQMRAVLATTCARWLLQSGDRTESIRHLGHAIEMVPDLRPAIRLLHRIYVERGDVRSAVMYLDQEIRATRHPREAAALYRERGQLVEAHFNDLSAAQQCYQAALKATPRDLAVLRSVERVSLARGDVFWLIANLEAQLEVLRDGGAASAILRDLALLEARHGGDLQLGCDLLLGALEQFPSHLGLISDLFRMAELAGAPDVMLQALEIEAEARAPQARAMPLARASLTLREHRERSAAVSLLYAAARSQPHNCSLWRNLEELSMSMSAYEEALAACVGQLRAVGDDEEPSARAELYYRVGKLALLRLDRVPEGLAAMRKALRLNPGHVPALADVGRYLITNQMWAQLLELLKLEISTAGPAGLTGEEIAMAHLRAGQVMEEHLEEPEGARSIYQEAIVSNPSYRPARDRLERLLHQLGRMDDLREFYRGELEATQSEARRVFLLSVLGQLHAQLYDPSEAINYLVALLKEVPEHLQSLQLLARLLAKADRKQDLLTVTEQEVRLTLSPGRRAKLLHRAGELALQLRDRDKAKSLFLAALEAVDDHPPSIESLERVLREDEADEELLELLRKRLLYANDRGRQVALRLEIATLLSTRLNRKDDALSELRQLIKRWPKHLPALHAAESLAASLGRYEVLIEVLEGHIATVTGPRTRALLLHRSANVRSSRLGDHEGAVRELARALELWPQLGVARALLLRLYEQLGRTSELQSFAESGLTSERGADDRRAMALQLAELTPKPVVAIQYLGAVAEARPEDFITQLRLARACRLARRPAREAGALEAAAERLADQFSEDDRDLLALRYRAARAQEAAGNLDAADESYARILDVHAGHLLGQRGRRRVKERKREAALVRSANDLEKAASKAKQPAEQAAYLTIAAELHERRRDLEKALAAANRALEYCAAYLPALHTRARILERIGDTEPIKEAIGTLEQLAGRLHDSPNRVNALCRAGTLALRTTESAEHNERAWALFAEALSIDPSCDPAFRGLQRTRDAHGTQGAPPLGDVLRHRLDALLVSENLSPNSLRSLARLGTDTDGPASAAELLERGVDVVPDDAGVHGDLAQAYARLGRWAEAVRELEAALDREDSPERCAALHYFAGDAHERAANLEAAVGHFLAAGRGGFHPKHALLSADRIAAKVGALEQRVEALQLLIDLGDGRERARSLRALADIHRGPLKNPDLAVELMRELLLLRPTDIDVIAELQRLLEKLGRHEEGVASVLAGVAHHRAWLRSQGLRSEANDELNVAPVLGLLRLFDAADEVDGVYVASGILEVIAPDAVPPGRSCDTLVTEPWPLPVAQEGRPFDVLIGDLPCSTALDLLREGVFYLDKIPGSAPPPVELSPRRSLPSNSGAVMVTRALSNAMGVPQPLVFLDTKADMTVVAHIGAAPCVIVGKKVNAAPFTAQARDLIGRALLRLTTGGDYSHRHASLPQLLGMLVGLCRGADVPIQCAHPFDEAVANTVAAGLGEAAGMGDLQDAAKAFAAGIESLDVRQLVDALQMAEDRAGAVCAADPRPAVVALADASALTTIRGTTLIGYLLSDDHLSLRRTLGYQLEIELELTDVEEV